MFKASIYDERGNFLPGSLKPSATAADYFTGCLYTLIDLLNGGRSMNGQLRELKLQTIENKLASQMAITFFLKNYMNMQHFYQISYQI